jgi:aspartyl-tRNA synthetase
MENSDDYLSGEQLECRIGARMKISGIVDGVRNQGGLLFVDIREDENLVQALVIPDNEQCYAMARKIEKGYLVEIKGVVKECPHSAQGEDIRKIEIEVEKMAIISARTEEENKSRRILDRNKILGSKNKNKTI